MGYLTAKQMANKWGITERRVIKLCKEDRLNGAIKNGMVWLIPEDTIKPLDKRSKISNYINTKKRVMIINVNNEIGYNLIPLLKIEGYIIEGTYKEKENINENRLKDLTVWKIKNTKQSELEYFLEDIEKYYDCLIIIDTKNSMLEGMLNKKWFIEKFSKKMNSESSIVLVNNQKSIDNRLNPELVKTLKDEIGLRINAINIDVPINDRIIINYSEIAEDILSLLTRFKNTIGISITTDGGYLEFYENGRTKPLAVGKFYKVINNYFKSLNKNSYMWCASTMMEDEWTDSPLEMNFRVNNLEAANRGANLERIFIFSRNKLKEFRENKTLKLYMQSNIKTMFVDYDEVKDKEPELLQIVGDGWDGIGKEVLIVDLPGGNKERGYVSINKNEIQKAYECFQKLKTYSRDLREVLTNKY